MVLTKEVKCFVGYGGVWGFGANRC